MKLLVTGCRGFVGGAVGRCAAASGDSVCGLGLASQPDRDWPGTYHQADVAHDDLSTVIQRFSPDVILHAAGTASVGGSLVAPLADLRAAVLTWANVIECVRRSGRSPLVLYPSSAAVYGNPQALPVAEDAPIAPISPYGYHKAACELLAEEYRTCFELNIVVARIFSLFGPRQRRLLVWEIFRQAVSEEPEILIKGTGEETRDYLYIDDAAEALLQLSRLARGTVSVVNLGSGIGTSVRNVVEMLAGAIGSHKPIRALGEPLPGDPRAWRADTRLLRNLGVTTPKTLQAGIDMCVREWQCT